MISYMISYMYIMISYMISVRLQLLLLPRNSALMQTMVNMSMMLTWTDQCIDADEERDYADQDPLSDLDMEEDAEILATRSNTLLHEC